MGKQRVRIKRLNFDALFYHSIMSGNGFIISEPPSVRIESGEAARKSLYGPRSSLYGTTFEDEQTYAERFTCECGSFKGRMYDGEICPFCGKPVKEVGDNIKMTGWIDLGKNNYIINPLYYHLLGSALGRQVFQDIISYRYQVDVDGNISSSPYFDPEKPPTSKYAGIGLDEFRRNYYEIMDYFREKKKNKASKIYKLEEQASSVFMSKIPVYTTKLRQQSLTADTFYYEGIDKKINPIYNISEILKKSTQIERPNLLTQIQKNVNDIWQYNFDLLNGKEGIIRNIILGGSLNYTSRNVIVPLHTLHDDEVDLSYHTFLELNEFLVIRYLVQSEGITLSQAKRETESAKVRFSQKIYELMQYIIEKDKPHILLNRNPTLNYYSMLLLKIHAVKKDFDDYTLSVPLAIDQIGRVAIKLS